jgi:hypothetical protein
MQTTGYDVRPWAGGWGVFVGEERAAVEPFVAAADAIVHAKQLARRKGEGAHILVHAEDGKLLSEFFYQPEEREILEDADGRTRSMAATGFVRREGVTREGKPGR